MNPLSFLTVRGISSYNETVIPLVLSWAVTLPLAERQLCKGDFALGDGETAGSCLLRVRLVQFAVELLESGCVKAVGKNRSEAADVRARFHFFHAALLHFGLDEVFEGFYHAFRFIQKGLPFAEFFDLGNDDVLFTHDIVPSFRSCRFVRFALRHDYNNTVYRVCLLANHTMFTVYSLAQMYTVHRVSHMIYYLRMGTPIPEES